MERSGRIVAVNHIGISVADLEAARRFWAGGLGAAELGGFSWPVGTDPADESLATPDTAADVVLLQTDTAFMELFAFSSPVPTLRNSTAPGIAAITWATADPDRTHAAACAAGGSSAGDRRLRCPDGTRVHLVATDGPTGLVGVEVRVANPEGHALLAVPGPVEVRVVGGAAEGAARPIDLGANHVCLDVEGIGGVRHSIAGTAWHHDVTESSGGLAAVCYGTTGDGVLVELLESRSPEAFLSRTRLAHP